MSVNSSRVHCHVDVADKITLRPRGSGAVIVTTLEAGIPLDRLIAALPGLDPVVPNGMLSVAINVAAINLSTNSYSLELLTDSVESMNDDPAVLLSVPLVEVGTCEVGLDASSIPSTHAFLAARVVIDDDDNPSIDWAAWLVQARAA